MPLKLHFTRRGPLFFFAPDTEAAPAAGAAPEAGKPAGGLNLGALRAAFTSKPALASRITDLEAQITSLTKERDDARNEAKAEKTRADGLQTQLEDGQRQIDELTKSATTVSDKTRDELSKLGVSAADLPPSADVVSGSVDDQIKALQAKLASATPAEKYKLSQQIKALRNQSKKTA